MAGVSSTTAVSGTADQSSGGSTYSDDAVLNSALTEMVTEGFQPDQSVSEPAPTTEPGQDEPAGHTPAGDAPSVAREGTASPLAAGTPAPSAQDPAPASEDDAFAKAPALTFMVDGTPQTFDAIKVFPGEGALIREADLPRLQTELANATHYLAQSRELVRQLHDVERVSEWTQTGPDGQSTILTGAPAIQAARVAHANTLAELTTLKQALSDPATLTGLIAGVDENGFVVLRPDAVANLATKAELLALKLGQSISQRFAQPTPQANSPADITAAAPSVVKAFASKAGVSGLTAEDESTLAAIVPKYLRAATQADRAIDPTLKIGEPVIDAAFELQVKHLGKVRSDAAANQAKAVTTATTVTKHNSAMDRARQPQRAAAKTATPAAPAAEPKKGKAEAWQNVFETAMQEIAT